MPNKKRIIFVDDEKNILDGLRRMLRKEHHEWDMSFASSGKEALNIMYSKPFDIIVTDLRMPVMDGVELLHEVKELYPQVVRIILSGQTEKISFLKTAGLVHQYLYKTESIEILKNALIRIFSLQEILKNKKLLPIISKIESIPSIPNIYQQLIEEIQSPNVSVKLIGEIVAKDIGLSAKIIQLVNSGFMGIRQQIVNPINAVSILGLDTIKALAVTESIFCKIDLKLIKNFNISNFWDHSVNVGQISRSIAKFESAEESIVNDAYISGLLHDVGKLLIALYLPENYEEIIALADKEKIEKTMAEREILGISHAEIGAYLIGLWGFPNLVVEAIAYHHNPKDCNVKHFNPLTVVHVANILENKNYEEKEMRILPKIDLDYLTELGLSKQLPEWQENCLVLK